MQLKLLRRTHKTYNKELLEKYRDLFEGGRVFRDHIDRYLPKYQTEPKGAHEERCKRAHYLNYASRIINFFASWLFTAAPEFKGSSDPFYAAFIEDADGEGTDLERCLRRLFVDAQVSQYAYVLVDAPDRPAVPDGAPPLTRGEVAAAGLDVVRLVPLPVTAVTNWKRDPQNGRLEWVLVYARDEYLDDLEDDDTTVCECWTQYYADGTRRRWELEYKSKKKPADTVDVRAQALPPHPSGRLPLVELCVPTELWLMDNLADAQLEHFRKRNALSYAIDKTCYAMPLFKLKNRKSPPVLGSGYWLQIGIDESMEWTAPPDGPYQAIAAYNSELKDEIHRIADQMAQGVDNNAAALGRSADSKQQDASSTEIVLKAYGALLRDCAERLLDLVSATRGEATPPTWEVGGFDHFKVTDADSIINMALTLQPLQIKSPTFQREMQKRVARSFLSDADEDLTQTIDDEIESNVTDEEALNPLLANANQMSEAGMDPAAAMSPNPPGSAGDPDKQKGPPGRGKPPTAGSGRKPGGGGGFDGKKPPPPAKPGGAARGPA